MQTVLRGQFRSFWDMSHETVEAGMLEMFISGFLLLPFGLPKPGGLSFEVKESTLGACPLKSLSPRSFEKLWKIMEKPWKTLET